MNAPIRFDNSYARLPSAFHARVLPAIVSAPKLIAFNTTLAKQLGLDASVFTTPEGIEILAGKRIPDGAEPIASAYAGHQFGEFNPQLGDGRAILLGEVIDRDGQRRDIQLKGSGPTPFSRRGDGRAALGPVLREYIVSEAMAALGIPTTRALAAVTTGESVYREIELPGAILTRVAASHIRVGTFQFFASRGDIEAVRQLVQHVINRHYPDAARAQNPVRAFLDGVIERQAKLVAQWLHVGFIHGVMNTDNMSVSGETIDYGPCAFVDAYDPATVFSSIDSYGRYAYANQPPIARWNLARLAECLIALLADDEEAGLQQANDAIALFADHFNTAYVGGLRRKLGLLSEQEGDAALAQDLLDRMTTSKADFTLTFRALCDAAIDPAADETVRNLFIDPTSYDAWALQWRARLAQEPQHDGARDAMRSANPRFIPRNHRVEAVIEAAVSRQDYAPLHEIMRVLSSPYDDQPAFAAYAEPPPPESRVYQTFCGT